MESQFGVDDATIEFDSEASTLRIQVYPRSVNYDEVRLLELGWKLICDWLNLQRLEVLVVIVTEGEPTGRVQ